MMEETANPTPSSTLAPEMPTTATGEPKANTTSIKLLIKASNQQHDDHIIESDLLWTVFRLKTQLSLVYPSKPPVSEQKLIYSGQLLNDRAQLKDIIRSYKDVYTQNHILHLVYTPKNQTLPPQKASKMTPTNSNDGLRQRHNTAAVNNTTNNNSLNNTTSSNNANQQVPQYAFLAPGMQQQFALNNANITANNTSSGSSFTGAFDMQTLAAQQAAMYNWMWHTYGQYMQQYSQINTAPIPSTGSPSNSTNPLNPVIAFPSLAPAAYFTQPYLGQQQHQIPTAAAAATLAVPTPSAQQAEPMQARDVQQPAPQAEADVVAAQPRFPNIVADEQENRDWLDSFFSIMRLALFLTILYFNSSPMRCFAVFLIAGGIYLYHIGFFRPRQERNNNDVNRINNAAAVPAQQPQQELDNANNDAAAEMAPNTDPVVSAATDVDNANEAASVAAQDATVENNSTSVIAFMRSFIVSFFTSLLPETPAAL